MVLFESSFSELVVNGDGATPSGCSTTSWKAASKRQQPYKYGSLTGERDFFFVAGR
jgi:hypothetical protein